MSRPARTVAASRNNLLATLGPILCGVPLGIGLLMLSTEDRLLYHDTVHRYTSHPSEQAAVLLFVCALCALAGKLLKYFSERVACRWELLTAWDGSPAPANSADALAKGMALRARWLQHTTLGRRVRAVLEFVASRGSANELDDQLRCLADNDAMALEASYSMLRFINWAIPILGFLGTVLGITQAISGVTPEKLEQSLSGVTDGLALAFDTTALGLFLTMILMLLCFLMERLEAGNLEIVDGYVDAELAHRFQRSGGESAPFIAAVESNAQVLLGATQQLVQQQADIWAGAIARAEQQSAQLIARQQEGMTAALQQALEYALTRYGQRLAELEEQLLKRNQALLDSLNLLAGVLRETGREQQLALAQLTDTLGMQMTMLAKVQSGGEQLARMQQGLAQNLEVLAGAGAFEQAVQSLTAAIHLLTSRAGGASFAPRLARPDAA
jgi:biopolymer transport protein ExbB/TolQ